MCLNETLVRVVSKWSQRLLWAEAAHSQTSPKAFKQSLIFMVSHKRAWSLISHITRCLFTFIVACLFWQQMAKSENHDPYFAVFFTLHIWPQIFLLSMLSSKTTTPSCSSTVEETTFQTHTNQQEDLYIFNFFNICVLDTKLEQKIFLTNGSNNYPYLI